MKNMNENPCSMCMPMGGILAFKGIEQAMVILHGSQGCSTYMRRHIAEHFNEPVDVGSSSLNEKGTIYGGENNLRQALDNVIKVYQPKLVGVLTTCLAETIGEDIDRIAADYRREKQSPVALVTSPTPGYGGSHSEGYWYTLRRVVEQVAEPTPKHDRVNIMIPHISPADIRELKRMLELMQVSYTLLPDISDTLDRPYEYPYRKVPLGGTPLEDIRQMAGAPATIELGVTVTDDLSPGQFLRAQYDVPLYRLPLPIGVEAVDAFVSVLKQLTGNPIPDSLKQERGRLLDGMIDSHKYNFQGRSVIFGEPEHVYAITKLSLENGVLPVVIATGSGSAELKRLLAPSLADSREQPLILSGTDFTEIRQYAKQTRANLAIGHSDGRYLEEREGIPLVRFGFPIHDRVGGQRLLSCGYTGTAMLLDRITNTLLEYKHKSYRRTIYEQHYRGLEQAN
jgi:nitrogenase molybdenum-iron protein NifN